MDKFLNWFKFQVRKTLISLKRNYYVIPLIFVAICCIQFMCSLYILSPGFARISNTGVDDINSYASAFTFVVSLLTILSTVAYINFALKKYGEKRPIIMVAIYTIMVAINLVLLFLILRANNQSVMQDYNKMMDPSTDDAARLICEKYVVLGRQCSNIVIAQIVLEIVSLVLVHTAPLVQAQLKKLKFKSIHMVGEKDLGEETNAK